MFALASDTDRPIAAFCLPISLGGSGASSPPSPIISGAVFANPTVSPFLLLGLVNVGPSGPGLSSPSALTWCASGHLFAIAMSSLGLLFSVLGLRKSTTSLFSVKVPWGAGAGKSSSLGSRSFSTLPHLLFFKNLLALDVLLSSSAMVTSTSRSPTQSCSKERASRGARVSIPPSCMCNTTILVSDKQTRP